MERFKKTLKKLFCLPTLPTILIAVPSFIFVFTVLLLGVQGVVSYVAYALSAYSMINICTGFPGIASLVKGYIENHPLKQKLLNHPLGNRYLNDAFFRAEVALYPGLFINLLYAGIKLFSGICYRSLWFGAMSVGIIGTLILGVGMCYTMLWAENVFILGIVIGIVGILLIIAAYPVFTHITKKRREKLTPQILKLTDELSRQK